VEKENWETACHEWIGTRYEEGTDESECDCGHSILHIFHLTNELTHKTAQVGSAHIRLFQNAELHKWHDSVQNDLKMEKIVQGKDTVTFYGKVCKRYDLDRSSSGLFRYMCKIHKNSKVLKLWDYLKHAYPEYKLPFWEFQGVSYMNVSGFQESETLKVKQDQTRKAFFLNYT